MIMAITKAVIAVLLVSTVCFCVITSRQVEGVMLDIILVVLGAYFGFSAKVYKESQTNRAEVDARLARAVERMRDAGRDSTSWRLDRE